MLVLYMHLRVGLSGQREKGYVKLNQGYLLLFWQTMLDCEPMSSKAHFHWTFCSHFMVCFGDYNIKENFEDCTLVWDSQKLRTGNR
jgi:hypothetical protein